MFVLLILATVLPLMLLRPRIGVIALIFLLAFMPRYLGLGIGDAGFALSPKRVAIIATLFALTGAYLVRPSIFAGAWSIVRQNLNLIVLLLLMFGTKLIATLLNSGAGVNLYYVIDDLLLLVVPALGVLLLTRSARDERQIILALVLALLVSSLFAAIESVKGSVLLQGLVEVSVAEAGVGGLTDNFRSDAYRAKAFFDNPLLLAEFACVIWPWAMYLLLAGQTAFARRCGVLALLAAPVALFLAHTRSGWLVFILGAVLFVTLRLWDKSSRVARVPLGAAYVLSFVALFAIAFQIATNSFDYLTSGIEGSRSVVERLNQYVVVAIAWLDSPIIGYGMTRNYSEDLEFLNNIDSYWLRLILEGGAVLLILFFVFVTKIVVSMFHERSIAPTREYRLFMTAAVVSAVSFCLYKLFLSMPTNNAYFLVVAVLVARRKYWCNKIYSNAHIAVPQ